MKTTAKKTAIALALLSFAIDQSKLGEVKLVPHGEFIGRDGRPTDEGLIWKLFDPEGRALAARLNARHKDVRFNFDYEHQALLSATNGQPAPASGWATTFEWRDGQGLFATDVKWTAAARKAIEEDEYAYISPAILYGESSGRVTGLHNASLTNIPNLDQSPIGRERVARLNASFSTTPEIDDMNPILKALLLALGLPAVEATTEAQATAALSALQANATLGIATRTALGLSATATEVEAGTALAALKAKPATTEPDPSKWVSLDKFNELNTQVALLTSQGVSREVDELIDQAKAEGKLMPAAEEVWRNVGKTNLAALRAMVEKTPGNPALAGKTQTNGKTVEGDGTDGLDAQELAMCKATGVDPKDFAKTKADSRAAV